MKLECLCGLPGEDFLHAKRCGVRRHDAALVLGDMSPRRKARTCPSTPRRQRLISAVAGLLLALLFWPLFARGEAPPAPRVLPITYNQELRTLLTSTVAQFDIHDWDGDGQADIIGLRASRGLIWHRNAGAGDAGLFESGLRPNEEGPVPPVVPSPVFEDRRLGRGFAFMRPSSEGGPLWIASIEKFANTKQIGKRPLSMHAWRQTGDEWTYVEPIDEQGRPYSISGDLWIGPVLDAADWNGDGKVDLLIGLLEVSTAFPEGQFPSGHRFPVDSFDYGAGRVYFLENISRGDDELRFAEPVVLRAGTEPIRGRGWTYPRTIDLTGNGVLDLVVGDNQPGMRAFLNKGTASKPELVEFGYLADENDHPILSTTVILPAFGDIDGDGRAEMVATCYPGAPQYFRWFKHSGEGNLLRGWRDQGYLMTEADHDTPVIGPGISTIEMVDWDGRGVHDILLGAEPGIPMIVRNVGTERERKFAAPERLRWMNGEPIELHAIELGQGSNWGPIESHIERFLPRSGDWDGDGAPDIITGSMGMRLLWLKGVRHDGEVRFERPIVFKFEGQELEVPHRTQPYLLDRDGDGALDVVALDPWNQVTIYYGDGTSTLTRAEPLLDTTGKPIQIFPDKHSVNSGRTGIAMVDWTGDGRLDLLIYKRPDGGRLYRNAGLAGEDRFDPEYTVLYAPIGGHNSGMTPFDWNGDGRLEILSGGGPGAFLYVIDGQSVAVPFQPEMTAAAKQ